jgi:WD40 repeat protein/serine/threonine protein kinase
MENASFDHESVLADLISLWQRRRAQGRALTPVESCGERSELFHELERRIAALERLGQLAGYVHEQATLDHDGKLAEQATLDRAATPTNLASLPAAYPYLPGYEILGELGRGGMGVVYKAQQSALGRIVALKMILLAGKDACERFRIEAEAVARLQHPNIVQVFEVEENNGLPYMSLEFCTGGSLADKLDGTPWEPKAAAQLVETLARAMEAAHQAKVIHRDLKPANVLLTAAGEPKVTDFGLAKKLDVPHGQTQTGAVMGTPSYMAPEQASGSKDIGPAADVYALGAILYELLTGRPPFKAATALDTILQVVSDEPVPPRRLQSKVPRDLETICLKCLQKQPARRYASAAALADDLRRFRVGEPIQGRPVSPVERGWRWCRRNPVTASLSAALLILLVAVAVGSTVAALYLNEKESEARHNADLADEARRIAVFQKEKARFNQYVAQMNLAQREYETNNIGHVQELLAAQVPRGGDTTDLRGFEWHYWQRMANRELLTLRGNPGVVCWGVSFSPDGRRLASAHGNHTVRVWDASTGQELLMLRGHTNAVDAVSFSPDGRRLASASFDQTVRVWDATTGQELRTLTRHTSVIRGVSFSPDGRRLASVSDDQTVRVWDASTGQELLTLKGHTDRVWGVSFSPNGQRLASASDDWTVRVWDAFTGQELLTLKRHTFGVRGVSFSPDGKWLASVSDDQTVRVWDMSTGQELRTLRGHTSGVRGVSFSPDGHWLASASGDKTVRVWDASTGQESLTLKGHTHPIFGVSFSPDGRRLASAGDQTVRVWDAASGQELLTLKGHTGGVESVSFSPDGRRLASVSDDRTVRVWDAASGQELLTLKGHTSDVNSVSFSPDGRRLASTSDDQTVRVWDASTGQELLTLKGHTFEVRCLSFSPNGQWLASAGLDRTVRVWDASTGRELLTLRGHTSGVSGVLFSPDGRRLASAGDQTVRVWDAASGQELRTFRERTTMVRCLSFSPNGRRLASAGDQTVRVWDAASGKELLVLKGHTAGVNSVSFSPDGRRLASAGDQTVRVWDASTGQELLTLKGHTFEVRCLSFSPDGRRLASAGLDRTVRVWEAVDVPDAVWHQRWLVSRVDSLFEELLLQAEVLAALRRDPTLDEADRKFAREVALSHSQHDAQSLNLAAWNVVKFRNAGQDVYARALRQVEAAVRLAPEDGHLLNTLGVAQYRGGRYPDALDKLTKSSKLNGTKGGSLPADLAFLAMAQHQLGMKDEAKAILGRLREVMKQPRWAEDAESVSFMREAEEMIEGKASDKVDRNKKPTSEK